MTNCHARTVAHLLGSTMRRGRLHDRRPAARPYGSARPAGAPRRRGLVSRADSAERHYVRGVDTQGLCGLCLGQPCELHDRAACSIQDQLLDLFDLAVDAMALAPDEDDLGDRPHYPASGPSGRASCVSPSRKQRPRRLAARMSIISLRFLASARERLGGIRAERDVMLARSAPRARLLPAGDRRNPGSRRRCDCLGRTSGRSSPAWSRGAHAQPVGGGDSGGETETARCSKSTGVYERGVDKARVEKDSGAAGEVDDRGGGV